MSRRLPAAAHSQRLKRSDKVAITHYLSPALLAAIDTHIDVLNGRRHRVESAITRTAFINTLLDSSMRALRGD